MSDDFDVAGRYVSYGGLRAYLTFRIKEVLNEFIDTYEWIQQEQFNDLREVRYKNDHDNEYKIGFLRRADLLYRKICVFKNPSETLALHEELINESSTPQSELTNMLNVLDGTIAYLRGVYLEYLTNRYVSLVENIEPEDLYNENDKEGWQLNSNGKLIFKGAGYLLDSSGIKIRDDNNHDIGITGIEGGLLRIFNHGVSDENKKTAFQIRQMLLEAGMKYRAIGDNPENPENWYWDLVENTGIVVDAPDYLVRFERMREQNLDDYALYSSESWLPGSNEEQSFEKETTDLAMKDDDGLVKIIVNEEEYQVYLKYVHNGVDRTASNPASDWIVSPGNYRIHKIDGHRLTLERIGTDRHTTIRHLNPADLNNLYIGQIFEKGDKIAPYPSSIFGPSTGIHVHIEENGIGMSGRKFMNPENHVFGQQDEKYGGKYYYKFNGLEIQVPEDFRGDSYISWEATGAR